LTAKQNSPTVGTLEYPHHPKQSRLAGTVGTDQCQYVTRVNFQGGTLQGDVFAVMDGYVAQA
jgi:hypothetical protein